jgi:hypothetical protein
VSCRDPLPKLTDPGQSTESEQERIALDLMSAQCPSFVRQLEVREFAHRHPLGRRPQNLQIILNKHA